MAKARPKLKDIPKKGPTKLEALKDKKKKDKQQQAMDQRLGSLLRLNLRSTMILRDVFNGAIEEAMLLGILWPSDPPNDLPRSGKPLVEVFAEEAALVTVEVGKRIDVRDIEIPDLWNIAKALKDQGSTTEGEMVLAAWNLAHKLQDHILKGLPCRKLKASSST